jgi:uncharacterized protein YggE
LGLLFGQDGRTAISRAAVDVTQPDGPQISVRADAQLSVAPDSALLYLDVTTRRESKAAALAATAHAVGQLLEDLAGLGGVVGSPGDGRPALSWLVTSATSHPDHDPTTGVPLAAVIASASVQLTARDFARLEELGEVLARHEAVSVNGVTWRVDHDNPAWPGVRADAIRAAIGKGHDYAGALGGELARLDHVADTGLLGGESGGPGLRAYSLAASGGSSSPSLDPVPQELTASIEARFTMTPTSRPIR